MCRIQVIAPRSRQITRHLSARGALLERDDDMAVLRAAVDSAAGGDGRLVVVQGEPGIGKSALLRAAAETADEGGAGLVRARAAELEREYAFGCVLQLFERRLHEAGDTRREALLAGSAALAAPLFERRLDALGAAGELFPILHGLFWLCSALAEERPLLITVDDAQWADDASVRFLAYLAERIDELPVALLVATRPPASGAAGAVLRQLLAHPGATHVRPAPLSVDAVRHIVTELMGDPDPPFLDACADAVGGNPLLLRELVHALTDEGRAPTTENAERVADIAPAPVTRAISLALERLDPAATATARAAAVLEASATISRLAVLTGIASEQVREAAAALRTAGVLAERPEVRFAHPLLRSAVYLELDPAERAEAHAGAARLLHEEGAAPEQVAAHLLEAPATGESWAMATLAGAARLAQGRGAPDTAVRLLRRALHEPGAEEDGDLLFALAAAETAAGMPEAGGRLAAALEAAHDTALAVEVLRASARLAYGQARFADAVTAFTEAIDRAPEDDRRLHLSLRAERAAAGLWIPTTGVRALEDLAPLVEDEQRPRTHAERAVLGNLAGAAMMAGDDRARAVRLALRAWGDGAFVREGSADDPAVSAITGALTAAEELAASRAVCDTLLEDARARGSVLAYATASYLRSGALIIAGRPREAAADAEAALDARRYGWSVYFPAAHWSLAVARLELGDLPGAREAVALSAEDEELAAGNAARIGLMLARGIVALADARYEEALAHLFELRGLRDQIGTDNPAFLGWRRHAIKALLHLGRREEAAELAEELLGLARRWGAPGTVGIALLSASAAADPGARLELAQAAVAELRTSQLELDLARGLVHLGSTFRSEGRREEARDPLREALDVAERCGGVAVAERARDELAASGARPRRARLSGPEALTPQELRVARLAASGLTNRQIAESLFITIKVVKWHLGNAYGKLRVTGREGLAEALAVERGDSAPRP